MRKKYGGVLRNRKAAAVFIQKGGWFNNGWPPLFLWVYCGYYFFFSGNIM